MISNAKLLVVQVIQFQTVHAFLFGAITSDSDYIMYKSENDPEFKYVYNELIIRMKTEDRELLNNQLSKSFKSMMKAGAWKTADIMIPQDNTF